MASHRHLLDVATRAAREAAGFIRASARPDTAGGDRKARNDFATDVDRGAERMIAAALLAGVPGSVVVGEELTPEGGPTGRGTDGSTRSTNRWTRHVGRRSTRRDHQLPAQLPRTVL